MGHSRRRIAIALGPGGRLRPATLIGWLVKAWRARGHEVALLPGGRLDGDLGLLHIDTTRVPPSLIPDHPASMRVLNLGATDISKRRVSRRLVRREDDYAGPVIVKTDDNYFGLPAVPASLAHMAGLMVRRVATPRTWRWLRALPLRDYPILAASRDVPVWVWTRHDLVVERFMPETDGTLYVLRSWVFFGDREFSVKLFGRDPIVKTRHLVKHEPLSSVPDDLRRERERLGLDFGKIDYVVHDGVAVMLDANKTPAVRASKLTPNLLHLAEGLADFESGV